MEATWALEILQWGCLLALALGLAACLRALRLLHLKVDRGYQPPETLEPGGLLAVPPDFGFTAGRPGAIVAANAGCSSCVLAAHTLLQLESNGLDVAVLWEEFAPSDFVENPRSFTDEEAAIRAFGATVLPYLVVFDADRRVVAVGNRRPDEIEDAIQLLVGPAPSSDKPPKERSLA